MADIKTLKSAILIEPCDWLTSSRIREQRERMRVARSLLAESVFVFRAFTNSRKRVSVENYLAGVINPSNFPISATCQKLGFFGLPFGETA